MKKTIALMLVAGIFGGTQTASAIQVLPNNIKNNTDTTITVKTTRVITQRQLGKPPKQITQNPTTTIAPGEVGRVLIQGGTFGTGSSKTTQLEVSAPGVESVTITSPKAKDYTASIKTVTPTTGAMIVMKKLIVE